MSSLDPFGMTPSCLVLNLYSTYARVSFKCFISLSVAGLVFAKFVSFDS